MQEYLAATDVIDWQHSDILQLAKKLKTSDTYTATKACFEWVRDNIYINSNKKHR